MPASRSPLPVSFAVLPSIQTPAGYSRPSAFLISTLAGIPVLRSLDPTPAGEPLVSTSLLLLALGNPPSDAWTLLRSAEHLASVSRDAAPVELDLAGQSPVEADVWLPLATARALAKALAVDDLLAGLLSWRTRRCASWLEPGDILAHNWRPSPAVLTSYSLDGLLAIDLSEPGSMVLVDEQQVLRTPLPTTLPTLPIDFPIPSTLQGPWHALVKLTALAHSVSSLSGPADGEDAMDGRDEVDVAVLLGMAEPLLDLPLTHASPLTPMEKTSAVRMLALAIRGARRASSSQSSLAPPSASPLVGSGFKVSDSRDRAAVEVLVERLGVFVVGWLRAQIPVDTSNGVAKSVSAGERHEAVDPDHHHRPHDGATRFSTRQGRVYSATLPTPRSAALIDTQAVAALVSETLGSQLQLATINRRLERIEDFLQAAHVPALLQPHKDNGLDLLSPVALSGLASQDAQLQIEHAKAIPVEGKGEGSDVFLPASATASAQSDHRPMPMSLPLPTFQQTLRNTLVVHLLLLALLYVALRGWIGIDGPPSKTSLFTRGGSSVSRPLDNNVVEANRAAILAILKKPPTDDVF